MPPCILRGVVLQAVGGRGHLFRKKEECHPCIPVEFGPHDCALRSVFAADFVRENVRVRPVGFLLSKVLLARAVNRTKSRIGLGSLVALGGEEEFRNQLDRLDPFLTMAPFSRFATNGWACRFRGLLMMRTPVPASGLTRVAGRPGMSIRMILKSGRDILAGEGDPAFGESVDFSGHTTFSVSPAGTSTAQT